ncbi:MAG: potassium channel family protein [Paracoccaceae bacterium]|nr:potassium channel family protein [Paracoccaceae bacterium]
MLIQLFVGAGLLVVCVSLHVLVLEQITSRLQIISRRERIPSGLTYRVTLLIFAALGAFLSHIAQIWIWAVVYILLGEFDAVEPALYFSTVAFTTVGFGDIILSQEWRLLTSFEAAAGLFLFGLSTAFLFEILREIRLQRRTSAEANVSERGKNPH